MSAHPLLPGLLLLLTALPTGCGLAEDERDEKNRYVHITFYDPDFERYCLENFDLDGDSRISRYEAQRVLKLDCSQRGIASLDDIGEFTHLRELRCSDNRLTQLDLHKCTRLERLDCSRNELSELDIRELRSLSALDCSSNALTALDLTTNSSLAEFDGRMNGFVTLDFTRCGSGLQADVRSNDWLTTVYRRAGQSVSADGRTEVVEP